MSTETNSKNWASVHTREGKLSPFVTNREGVRMGYSDAVSSVRNKPGTHTFRYDDASTLTIRIPNE
jgi:hypothetical protein